MSLKGILFRDGGYFKRGYADHLPAQFIEALKEEQQIAAMECMAYDGIQLYRAQGAATVLKELIDTLTNGVSAPAPDAGISLTT